jgi:3-oxoadipate enol-lactonase
MLQTLTLGLRRVSTDTLPPGRPVHLPGRGTTFAYEELGPPGAPTLILAHGLGASGALNWFPAFGPLSDRFRVVAIDLRGHGRGIPCEGRFRISDCADDVVALADVLGIDRFVAVGYSLGGPVAQLAWRRHRDRVAGLVLCATSRNFGGRIEERLFFVSLWAALAALDTTRFLPFPRAAFPHSDGEADGRPAPLLNGVRMPRWALDEFRRCRPETMLRAMSALGRFSSHDWIAEIDVPTAVVVTTRDHLVSPARQRKLARAIRGATVHPARSDHGACVIGANRFVPALVEACTSVVDRIPVGLAGVAAL